MFNRVLDAFGIGGPSVDAVLDSPHTVPGQAITGQIRVSWSARCPRQANRPTTVD